MEGSKEDVNRLSIRTSIHPSFCLFIRSSIQQDFYLHFHPFIHPYIYSSIAKMIISYAFIQTSVEYYIYISIVCINMHTNICAVKNMYIQAYVHTYYHEYTPTQGRLTEPGKTDRRAKNHSPSNNICPHLLCYKHFYAI